MVHSLLLQCIFKNPSILLSSFLNRTNENATHLVLSHASQSIILNSLRSSRIQHTNTIQYNTKQYNAIAGFCNNDQFDRPTAGAANVCMDSITLNADGTVSEASIEQFEVVLIHEVGHVLGFIANAFSLFWDTQTRQRRTPRPFEITNVKCVNGETITIKGFPSENTIQFIDDPLSSKRTAYLVTPRVKSVARNQFNCHDLEGAALENTPTMAGDCIGSHWDERLFYSESMSGIISPTTNIMSPLSK